MGKTTKAAAAAPAERPREPINFTSARLHFLWKLNKGADTDATALGDVSNWRRRIYYVQFAVPVAGNSDPVAYLLYGSEKDEKVVELMTLSPKKFKWSNWDKPIDMDKTKNVNWEKRVLDDEQYELAFLQRKTHLERQFPTKLYPFTVSTLKADGSVDEEMVLATEYPEDREAWKGVIKEYKPSE